MFRGTRLNVILHGTAEDRMCLLQRRVSSLVELSSHIWLRLIWGLTTTHSEYTTMAALGRIMKGVRAHSWIGSAGDVDPARLLEPFDSPSHCQSYCIVAPGRSHIWHFCCPFLAPVVGGLTHFLHTLSPFTFHYLKCVSHSGHTEGHLAEWVSHIPHYSNWPLHLSLSLSICVSLITALRFTVLVTLPLLATVNHLPTEFQVNLFIQLTVWVRGSCLHCSWNNGQRPRSSRWIV